MNEKCKSRLCDQRKRCKCGYFYVASTWGRRGDKFVHVECLDGPLVVSFRLYLTGWSN